MKCYVPIPYFLVLVVMPLSALAHDPSMHKPADAAPPDCSSMKNMDPSPIDMNDPLMKALVDQCKDDPQPGPETNGMPGLDKKPELPADTGGTY